MNIKKCTYKNCIKKCWQSNLDFSIFEKQEKGNVPVLNEGIISPTYLALNNLAH